MIDHSEPIGVQEDLACDQPFTRSLQTITGGVVQVDEALPLQNASKEVQEIAVVPTCHLQSKKPLQHDTGDAAVQTGEQCPLRHAYPDLVVNGEVSTCKVATNNCQCNSLLGMVAAPAAARHLETKGVNTAWSMVEQTGDVSQLRTRDVPVKKESAYAYVQKTDCYQRLGGRASGEADITQP